MRGGLPHCPAVVTILRYGGKEVDCAGVGDPVPGHPGQFKCRLCNNIWSLTPEQHLAEFEADTAREGRN